MSYLGEFLSYLLAAVFAQHILLDKALGLDGILAAVARKRLLWRLVLLVSGWSAAGVLAAWGLSRFVTDLAGYFLLAMMFLLLSGGMYFAADRLLLRYFPEEHDVWGPVLPHALLNTAAAGMPLAVLAGGIPHWYEALGMGVGSGFGLALAVLIVQGGIDMLDHPAMPPAFRGTPGLLLFLGILSLGFCAFF